MSVSHTVVPKPIEATRILIGEGREEELFLGALLNNIGIMGVQVESYNGKSELGPFLKALKNRSGFVRVEKLAITRDADADPISAAASVDAAIAQAGFSAQLNVSRMILPGNTQAGALENLCLLTIANQPVETYVEDYLACAARVTGIVHTTSSHQAKARIHAWLAAQQPPDLRLGIAAQKGMLDWNSSAFDELKAFLRLLA